MRLQRLSALGGVVLLSLAPSALAQRGGHSAPAPAPRPAASPSFSSTGHDVIHAFGLGPNAGFHSGARLTPQINNFSGSVGGFNPTVQNNQPLIGSPDNFFPSKTTGFSTAPLFPYSSTNFPYGYGFLAREPMDEYPRKPVSPTLEVVPDLNVATMNVRVPADATIWFEGRKTGQRGARRTFLSPPLEPGQGFTYEVRARWLENGKEIEQTRQVHVHAGERVDVDFSAKK